MRVYVASGLGNMPMARLAQTIIRSKSHEITYDWTQHGGVWRDGPEAIERTARNEINGVKSAHIVVVLLPGGRGTHAELGMALALGKVIVVCSPDHSQLEANESMCVFYHHKGNLHCIYGTSINCLSFEEALKAAEHRVSFPMCQCIAFCRGKKSHE